MKTTAPIIVAWEAGDTGSIERDAAEINRLALVLEHRLQLPRRPR